ncbi:MAG: ABC-type transport auxiliary lipoprotein family protein [Hyphomicrobiales bacterium]|nr:ABC-type transport auxiliary lipoprotein family protein [Hyphomicrobiales bacterium]
MLRLRRDFGIVLLSVQLGGCAALGLLGPPPPPPTTYDLSARADVRHAAEITARLGVRIPNAIQLFDSERIVIRPQTGLAAYYADAQWTDRLPRLVEARLIEAFNAAGVRTVTRMTDGLTVDYQLLSEVRDFSVSNAAGDHKARVSLYVQLVSDKEGRTLTGRDFTATAPVAGGDGDAAAGVAALNDAFSQVLVSVVRWTLAKI